MEHYLCDLLFETKSQKVGSIIYNSFQKDFLTEFISLKKSLIERI